MAAHENTPSVGARAADADGGPPLHVAIVMDGNGRWAKQRGLPRSLGHRAGVEALKRTVSAAPKFNIRWLTVFGFSTENWSRPAAEVAELMALPQRYFESDIGRLEREGVRVRVIGSREGLSRDLVGMIDDAQARTARNDAFHLNIAFNYGGQADLVEAARRFAEDVAAGRAKPSDLDPATFAARLATADLTRARRHHPAIGRAAALQLPPLGSGLCRAGFPGRALAGLRRRSPQGCARRVRAPGTALRRCRSR